jgi:hypothetical protein
MVANVVRQTVKVAEGGRIEVVSPELLVGDTAEVIVLLTRPATGVHGERALALLEELQTNLALSPEKAAAWVQEVAAERAATHPRGLAE